MDLNEIEIMFNKKSPLKAGDAISIKKFIDKNLAPYDRTPENVLDLARPVKSPLHKYFTWDNTVAAEKYRLQQAGNLLRVIIEVRDGTRHYVNVKIEKKKVYVTQSEAKADINLCRQLLDRAVGLQLSWFSQYSHFTGVLENFPGLVSDLEKIKREGVNYECVKESSKGDVAGTKNRGHKNKNKRHRTDTSEQPGWSG